MPSQAAQALCRRRRGVLSPLPLPPAPTPCAPVRHRRARWRTHLHHNHRDHRGIGARVRPGSPTMTGQCEKSTHGRSEINREIRYETTWDTTGEFPDLIGTYQPTPTSRLPSRLTSFPSLGTTTASPSFAPPGAGRFPVGLDHFYRGARAASQRWRRRDLPGSWTTLAYMPRSSTPTDRRPQATTGTAMWSSA